MVQRKIWRALGQNPQSDRFARAALEVLKRLTDPRFVRKRQFKTGERREYVAKLTKSLRDTVLWMKVVSSDAPTLRQFAKTWAAGEYDIDRSRPFSFPTTLLEEIADVSSRVERTITGARGGRSLERRNLVVAQLAETYERCMGVAPTTSARDPFAAVVKVLLPECGFSGGRIDDILKSGLRERDIDRAGGRDRIPDISFDLTAVPER